jgi:hypothetical protein
VDQTVEAIEEDLQLRANAEDVVGAGKDEAVGGKEFYG